MPDLESQLRAYGEVVDRAEPEIVYVDAMPDGEPRPALLALAAAAVVIVIAVAAIVVTRDGAPRSQVVTPPTTTVGPIEGPAPTPILAIGDSVMLGASPEIRTAIPGIELDAVESRKPGDAAEILRAYGNKPRTIVVALGTNHSYDPLELADLLDAVGDRRLVLINNKVPRAWESENNDFLRAVLQSPLGRNVVLVDWHKIAQGHDDWFAADGFHVKGEGKYAYASAIASALGVPAVQGLTLEEEYPHSPFEGKTLLAEAAGDVWIAAEHQLERRRPDGTLVATIDLPFRYGVENIAASPSAVWVNGMVSDAGPEFGLVRVDTSTNRIALDLRSSENDSACACMIAASDNLVAVNGNGSLQGVDAQTGSVVSNTFDLNITALAVIDDRMYVGGREAVQILRRNGSPPHVIELQPGDGDVRALTPTANGELLIATTSGRVYRGGRSATLEGEAPNAVSVDEGDRDWAAGGPMVTMVADGVSNGFVYDVDAKRFARGTSTEDLIGFTGVVSIADRLWLATPNAILRVRVDE